MKRPTLPILLLATSAAISLLLPPHSTPTPATPPATNPSPIGEIYIFGHVPRPGVYSIGLKPQSLRQAIVNAGVPAKPTPRGTVTLRRVTTDRNDLYSLDLEPLIRDRTADLSLRPNDEINVRLYTPPPP